LNGTMERTGLFPSLVRFFFKIISFCQVLESHLDVLKQLLSALSSYRRRGGTQTHSSSIPGSFKPCGFHCGFHDKTVDWMCSHTEIVWNVDRLQQRTSPSQGANMKYYSISLFYVLMDRPHHQQSDISLLIFRPYLG